MTTMDAFLVLQEKIYQVLRNRKILSLITFKAKRAFTKVAVKVLIDRLEKHRIPERIVSWIDYFCPN